MQFLYGQKTSFQISQLLKCLMENWWGGFEISVELRLWSTDQVMTEMAFLSIIVGIFLDDSLEVGSHGFARVERKTWQKHWHGWRISLVQVTLILCVEMRWCRKVMSIGSDLKYSCKNGQEKKWSKKSSV